MPNDDKPYAILVFSFLSGTAVYYLLDGFISKPHDTGVAILVGMAVFCALAALGRAK